MSDPTEITRLLRAHAEGERESFDRLVTLVYEDLRMIARRELRRSRPDGLRTTALVHEAYARLATPGATDWDDRRHFFGAAARAMRFVVVDHARRRGRIKRGGNGRELRLEEVRIAVEAQSESILAVDQALRLLAGFDERLVRVVECRFFAGFTVDETAETLNVSRRTVERDWMKARGWLRRALGEVG
ncbi:MAG TPA: ECF-type sigma factor [Gemmatimonadota bacterium]|nr:ECF-type sigma factor [Gemmatimonadota bacterium]